MAQRPPGSFRLRDRPYLIACAIGGVLLVVLAIVVASFVGFSPTTETRKAAPAVLPANPAALPQSTTYTVVDGAPLDLGPLEATDGTVVHPQREIVVYESPGGAAIARLGPQQIGETWLPVIASQPGWIEVLL